MSASIRFFRHLLIAFAVLFTHIISFAQPTAHTAFIEGAYADGKGEVAVTLDRDGIAKFWGLADGKLITSIKKGTPEWNSKLLRYRVQHYDFTGAGISQKWEGYNDPDSIWSAFLKEGEVVTRIRIAQKMNPSFELHRSSGKIAFNTRTGYPNDLKTQVYMVSQNSQSPNKRGDMRKLAEINGWSYSHFSHKGTWLWLPSIGMLIHSESGQVVNIDVKPPKVDEYKFAFNADETLMSLVTEDGIIVIEVATGKEIRKVNIPKQIRQKENFYIYPCSDGASFIYTGRWSNLAEPSQGRNRAWLVKETGAVELVD